MSGWLKRLGPSTGIFAEQGDIHRGHGVQARIGGAELRPLQQAREALHREEHGDAHDDLVRPSRTQNTATMIEVTRPPVAPPSRPEPRRMKISWRDEPGVGAQQHHALEADVQHARLL